MAWKVIIYEIVVLCNLIIMLLRIGRFVSVLAECAVGWRRDF